LGIVRDGGVLPDPGKVFILEFSSAIVFYSRLDWRMPLLNVGMLGISQKKTADRAPVLI
jgi:hypothetical protein